MKKAIYTLGLILMAFQFANAQCVPNPNTGTHGYILPDSTQFPHAVQGSAGFDAVIQIKVAYDTVTVLGTFVFDSIFITGVSTQPALPNGITIAYTCSAPRCSFLGNSTNCIDVHVASPGLSAIGTYRIIVNATAKGTLQTLLGNIPNQSQNATIDWYKLIVDGAGSASLLPSTTYTNELVLNDVLPNPAIDQINLEFFTTKSAITNLNVIDVIGKTVASKELISNVGINKNSIEISKLANGVYLLNLQSEGKSQSKKFVVNH